MQVELGKWGNSVAMRIPSELLRQSGLKVGAKAEIVFEDGCLKLKPIKEKMSRAERLEMLIASYKELGPDEEVDWGLDVGNEMIE